MAVTISNIGFMISVLGDFTVDRQATRMAIGSGVIYLHRATPRAASRAWDTPGAEKISGNPKMSRSVPFGGLALAAFMNGSGATISAPPGSRANAVTAASISASSRTGVCESSTASDGRTAPNSRMKNGTHGAVAGLNTKVVRLMPGRLP
jgi:hypothetical protein